MTFCSSVIRLSCAGLAAFVLLANPAAAKQCKDASITATSREYLSRSLGAFPGSWAAWRKKVKAEAGNGWQAWRRAEDRKIECEQAENVNGRKRWTCTRVARPCRPGAAQPDDPIKESKCRLTDTDLVPIDRVLRRGMSGEQVTTLQCLLQEADFDVETDGVFGRTTERAVRRFQRRNQLSVDGRAGPRTVEALTS